MAADPLQPVASAALDLYDDGWEVLPLPHRAKTPPPKDATGAAGVPLLRADVALYVRGSPRGNVGVRLPEFLVGLDVDAYGEKKGAETLAALEDELGPLPPTIFSTSRADGVSGIRVFSVPAGHAWREVGGDIETIQRRHRFVVTAPSVHPLTGEVYALVDQRTGEVLDRLPPCRAEEFTPLPDAWVEWLMDDGRKFLDGAPRGPHPTHADAERFLASLPSGPPCQGLDGARAEVLAALDEPGSRHDAMVRATLRLTRLGDQGHRGAAEALEVLRAEFVARVGPDRGADVASAEFDRALLGAIARVKSDPSKAECRCDERYVRREHAYYANAGLYLEAEHAHPVRPTLLRHRGRWYEYVGTHWVERSDETVRSRLWSYFGEARVRGLETTGEDDDGNPVREWVDRPFGPSRAIVENLAAALASLVLVSDDVDPGSWLDGRPGPDPRTLLPMADGLLNLRTREVLPPTPALFALNALPYSYDPTAPPPVAWVEFLDSVWGDDPDSIDALQEWLGYFVSGEVRAHKALLLIGPRRSGKGTLSDVLTAVLGEHNVAGPSLTDLATNFGLSDLVTKPLAIVSDARLRKGSDLASERLLRITGQDRVQVDVKNRDPWVGKLPTRFLIHTNELPRLNDGAGVLPSRFIILQMTKSFYGKEDVTLADRLAAEVPSILVWALDGYDRLAARGFRFRQPESAAAAVRDLEETTQPLALFVDEVLDVHPPKPGAKVTDATPWTSTDDLYDAYKRWSAANGFTAGSVTTFVKDLKATLLSEHGFSTERKKRTTHTGARVNGYVHVTLDVTSPHAGGAYWEWHAERERKAQVAADRQAVVNGILADAGRPPLSQ